MRIFLRILVVVILLLSAASLAIGIKLFNQREVVKSRTLRLEEHVRSLGRVIEDGPAEVRDQPQFTALDGEEEYTFWQKYLEAGGAAIEATDATKIIVESEELKRLYQPDPLNPGKDLVIPDVGKSMKGPGTLDNVLTNMLEQATAQLNRMNDTRYWLTQMRGELDATLGRHNTVRGERDEARDEVKDLTQKNDKLKETLREKDAKLADLHQQNEDLEQNVRDLEDTRDELEEKLADKAVDIESLEKQNAILRDRLGEPDDEGTTEPGTTEPEDPVIPGQKGKIVFHDAESKFVIMNVTGDSDLRAGLELTCIRSTSNHEGTPTGKLLMREIYADKGKGVADIVNDWKIEEGDIVLF